MKWFPGLFDSKYGRIKVLKFMYLDYGNGYDWHDGKLIDNYLNTDVDMYNIRKERWYNKREDMLNRINILYDNWENFRKILSRTGDDDDYLSKIQDEIDELQDEYDNFDPYGKEYPNEKALSCDNIHISNYSPIFHIPKDIKPDYLEGAKEIIKYILSIGFKDDKINKVAKEIGLK